MSEPQERRGDPGAPRATAWGESEGPLGKLADVAQLAERVLGKDEVTSSILVIGSNLCSQRQRASYGWQARRADAHSSRIDAGRSPVG